MTDQTKAAVNMDLNQDVVISTHDLSWSGSRADNVLRKVLEREEAESGRATSVVAFLPGSRFPGHFHPMGEEILVLEGVFEDEFGQYPAGTYLRNPPGSKHAPACREGCKIFVKLEQFHPMDTERVMKHTPLFDIKHDFKTVRTVLLHQFRQEQTMMIFWPAGQLLRLPKMGKGEEILVLQGKITDPFDSYSKGTWIRREHGHLDQAVSEEDTILFVKTGHLAQPVTH